MCLLLVIYEADRNHYLEGFFFSLPFSCSVEERNAALVEYFSLSFARLYYIGLYCINVKTLMVEYLSRSGSNFCPFL